MADWSSSPWYNTAVNAANAFGVPANLFVAQIGQESSFNPSAQNGNATGIAQFMPGTAAQYGVNASDPTSSLYGAAKYDAALYSQYGSWQQALAKYGTTANNSAPTIDNLAAQADSSSIVPDPFNFLNSVSGGLFGSVTSGIASTAGAASSTASGVGTLLGIITDVPRMITLIIGLLMLGAGLLMLSGRSPVTVVAGAIKAGAVAAA